MQSGVMLLLNTISSFTLNQLGYFTGQTVVLLGVADRCPFFHQCPIAACITILTFIFLIRTSTSKEGGSHNAHINVFPQFTDVTIAVLTPISQCSKTMIESCADNGPLAERCGPQASQTASLAISVIYISSEVTAHAMRSRVSTRRASLPRRPVCGPLNEPHHSGHKDAGELQNDFRNCVLYPGG